MIEYILDGKFNPITESSIEAYFREWAVHARYFSIPSSELWVIERLKRHLNRRINNMDRATYGLDLNSRYNTMSNRQKQHKQWDGQQNSNTTQQPERFEGQQRKFTKKPDEQKRKPIFRRLTEDTPETSSSEDDHETMGESSESADNDNMLEEADITINGVLAGEGPESDCESNEVSQHQIKRCPCNISAA